MARPVATTLPRARWRWAGRIVAAFTALVLAVLVLLPDRLGAGGAVLDRWLPFAVLVAFRPPLAVAAAVAALLVGLVRRRARPAAAALLVVSLVALALVVPRAVAGAPPPAGGPALTVLTFNVDEGEADVAALAGTVRRTRPDVVVLPEAATRYAALLGAEIPDLGYRPSVAARPGAPDVAGVTVLTAPVLGPVASRVISQGRFDPWLELSGGRLGALRLVAVHVSAPVPGKIESWSRELAQLRTWCGPGEGPVVLAGDFNATLDHSGFRDGTQGCRDAGAASGQGLVPTWNAGWPRWFGVQIDHVLVGGGPECTGMTVLDLPGSDHRAVLARVRLG
jgi:endonuclease/exonuclease/phosphatase (EEP) superfamily protein YafD